MDERNRIARIAGVGYLAMIMTGIYSLMYVPTKLIVRGNAGATIHNILDHELLFRSGIVVELFATVIFMLVVLSLHRLFRGVDGHQSVLMVAFALVSSAVAYVNTLNEVGALIVARGETFLATLATPQREVMAMLLIKIHGQGNVINEIFWGLWLFPFGILVIRSGFLPRLLGYLLLLNGVAWIAVSLTSLLGSDYAALVERVARIPETGEIMIMLWLLIRGAGGEGTSKQSADRLVAA